MSVSFFDNTAQTKKFYRHKAWRSRARESILKIFDKKSSGIVIEAPQMYYAYILQNLKDGSYYYGSAENLNKRLHQHNLGKVRYTKGHLPYKLHYSEEYPLRSDAIKREKFFKSIAGYRWLRKENIIK